MTFHDFGLETKVLKDTSKNTCMSSSQKKCTNVLELVIAFADEIKELPRCIHVSLHEIVENQV